MRAMNIKLLPFVLLSGVISNFFFSNSSDAVEQAQTDTTKTNAAKTSVVTITRYEQLDWTPLNPARGKNSPQAANLWGDRSQTGATGFLVQFKKGFSSPPHIHNVTYKGIVLNGEVHNDDPKAASMWMPEGAFWTQPKGESHITAAQANFNLAYIEIQQGPYLVKPAEHHFDSGERPINVAPQNLVWQPLPTSLGVNSNAEQALLWGSLKSGETNGRFIKMAGNSELSMVATKNEIKLVVVANSVLVNSRHVHPSFETDVNVGSLIKIKDNKQSGEMVTLQCTTSIPCVLYARTQGDF